jgi:hypothetical protein
VWKKAVVACAKVFPAYYVETDHNLENEQQLAEAFSVLVRC